MKPKIIIDALALMGPLTGIGRYTYKNAQQVSRTADVDLFYFYGYFSDKLMAPSHAPRAKSLKSWIVKNPLIKWMVRSALFKMSGWFGPRFDLYWQPNFIPNHSIKANKIIATVHDFSWEIYPEFQPHERVNYFQKYFYSSIQKCDHIITGSEFTKQEIIERTGFEPKKISVIYHGVDHHLFYPRSSTKPAQKYILAVGSIEPRKNLKNLIQAYKALDVSMRNQYHLILVGAQGWNNDEILNEINHLSRWVHYSGFVSDEELAILYSNASLFIYPSVYEGFGIPPLEAMACGTPVICSNVSSLPEVGGDAVVYCDPYNIQDIKRKIELVLDDALLQQELRVKGVERANMFSWKRSAKKHLDIFEKVLAQ